MSLPLDIRFLGVCLLITVNDASVSSDASNARSAIADP